MKLEDEIKQSQFKSEYQKVGINLLFTASWMNKINTEALKPFNISIQQFNILRILRGLGNKPASIKLLTERMIDKMSNASRLVEKLKAKGLVERVACPDDRRQVDILITEKGLSQVEKASKALESNMQANLESLTESEAKILNGLLDQVRS
jgi:DNA-binding MarR family transcriptional regulator